MPEALIDRVAAAAAEAGKLALDRWETDFRRWEKAPGSPVCEVDLAVDELLKLRLKEIDPAAGWLSEETADNDARLGLSRVWVVDPIDGTRDYLRGRPGWCISVALVEDHQVVLGVLDAPARGEQWRAVAGGGATRNGLVLRASMRTALPGARVPADTLPKIDEDLIAVPRANSIALRIAMVAADKADLCASLRWGNEWDLAAAALIAEEAGATVTDALGVPIRYNGSAAEAFGVLASAPAIHTAAVARLAERASAASIQPR
ncbi:MAG TPA: inositol monophosphatase family protein [Sphingomonas sp.]|uniref:inositol monophosphatase family protein n=1 Tax=Sphingomonas sp. TaxID=28214 RepID=UPI002CD9A416|nr:inositol monophosphatase family protein [Sphingomonas sp.]HMI18174.1 inositol monophosphatase family protein [Sphingomonas sp.]